MRDMSFLFRLLGLCLLSMPLLVLAHWGSLTLVRFAGAAPELYWFCATLLVMALFLVPAWALALCLRFLVLLPFRARRRRRGEAGRRTDRAARR